MKEMCLLSNVKAQNHKPELIKQSEQKVRTCIKVKYSMKKLKSYREEKRKETTFGGHRTHSYIKLF
jgi:hypothetical protein